MTGLNFPSVLFHLSLVFEVRIRQASSTGGSNLHEKTMAMFPYHASRSFHMPKERIRQGDGYVSPNLPQLVNTLG